VYPDVNVPSPARRESVEIVTRTIAGVEHECWFCAGNNPEIFLFYVAEEREIGEQVEAVCTGRGISRPVNVAKAGGKIRGGGIFSGGHTNVFGWFPRKVAMDLEIAVATGSYTGVTWGKRTGEGGSGRASGSGRVDA